MGCGASKLKKQTAASKAFDALDAAYKGENTNVGLLDNMNNTDELEDSLHGRTKKQRMARFREMDVSRMYKIHEIVGHGSMGEVTLVTKIIDSVHTMTASNRARSRQYLSKENNSASISSNSNSDCDQVGTSHNKHHMQSARKYACKTVNTVRMKDREIKEFINEVDILRELDHPNIIQLFEVYKNKRKIWIITELCTGGDLTSRIDTISENDVATIMEQIARAMYYMHKRNVCHRDLKLENIMYANPDADAPIKLIDFGLSNKFTKDEKMRKACGTIYAAAPELFFGEGYTEQADIWSIGVVAFVLLSQVYPFLTDFEDIIDHEKKENFENAIYKYGPEWEERGISSYAKGFCDACLRRQPSERWSAYNALQYIQEEWIPHVEDLGTVPEGEESSSSDEETKECTNNTSSASSTSETVTETVTATLTFENRCDSKGSLSSRKSYRKSLSSVRKRTRMDSNLLAGMTKFILYGELKKTILMTMAYAMDKSSLKEIREIFETMDSRGDGIISLPELKEALQGMHSEKHLDDGTIEKLFHGIDQDNNGHIAYNEFLAAVVESQGLITMEHLADAFDRLDSDKKGYISKDDLKDLLGEDYDEQLVNRMIEEADFKRNGQVDYDEFLRLMFEDPTAGLQTLGNSSLHEEPKMVERLGHRTPTGGISMENSDAESDDEIGQDEIDEIMKSGILHS
mmetsp:Transcript_10927/g.16889  ORF Transcript_10927/g.16889 Transcript_10927/m.16889 type:complete len:690 (+) Transcript_10927:445-2514(+)|eukprot:CAMPEP_0195288520 /NCGR_PEP_ID=MMETSP0707-20130614/5156_1 /TAXON_ID=33640 /ORGANISM="Asterionellopsis glacialis, Strain CCMP134" /LENGTH=689 /DNA_ID=CAMNT_0040348401 /DNA_START=393 /DNA_END=2462 /DNA_ORIENTATION=+